MLEVREGPAPSQWQAVRDEIKILYEKHPLRDVRKILERKYNFRAT
jgi:Clr5 domain